MTPTLHDLSPTAARDDRGAVAVMVALVVAFVLIPVAALSIDLGQVYVRQSDLQAIADAAARAGAEQLAIAQRDEANPVAYTAALTAARAQAVQALCVGVTGGTDPWYASCSGPATWAADGDPDNGEVSLYTGVPDAERGFTTTPVNGTTATVALTGIRVVTPPSRVTFGLAGAFGQTHADPQTASTAGIFTVLPKNGFLPMYLTPDDHGPFCTRSAPRSIWETVYFQCGGSPTPSPTVARGFLTADRTRSTENANATLWNTAVGFDDQHQPLPIPGRSATLAPNLDDGYSHVWARLRDLSAGLFTGTTGVTARVKGTTCPGGNSASTYGVAGLEGAYLTDFVDTRIGDRYAFRGRVLAGNRPTPQEQGWLDPRILRCGRLAVVPVLATITNPPPINGFGASATAWPVSHLRLVWLDDRMWATEPSTERAAYIPGADSPCFRRGFYWSSSESPSVCQQYLRAYTGYVLDPRLLPATVADTDATNVLDRFVGSGMPATVRLLRDVGDPPPR